MDFPSNTDDLLKQLHQIELSNTNMLRKTNSAISLCRNLLSKLKKEIVLKGFASKNKEIDFFKVSKQIPLSNLIYYSEVRSFEMQFPRGCKKEQCKFINKKLKKLNRFFIYNMDFVKYIELKHTHLDDYYFMRCHSNNLNITHSQVYFFDTEFNTSHDLLLGKLKAYKRFIRFLENCLNKNTINNSSNKERNLEWTSTKVALTELVYALYHNNVFNNGSADIKDIADALQQSFNFELGDFYKVYSEIKLRKKSRTKFLDELSIGLSSEMNKSDA